MSDRFPAGSGVMQGPVSPGRTDRPVAQVVADDRPPPVPGQIPRPWPTDPGGMNDQGWMKVAQYDDGYYGASTGLWKQT